MVALGFPRLLAHQINLVAPQSVEWPLKRTVNLCQRQMLLRLLLERVLAVLGSNPQTEMRVLLRTVVATKQVSNLRPTTLQVWQ